MVGSKHCRGQGGQGLEKNSPIKGLGGLSKMSKKCP